ncbi:hypothetical protein [Enterococcus avium]|uniref:hypothetical protein n=1 Tax=Enterococcus avium TaxID=33945 RepID=UPI001F58519B|nr:hypothetical protein [Enterococcus avium]
MVNILLGGIIGGSISLLLISCLNAAKKNDEHFRISFAIDLLIKYMDNPDLSERHRKKIEEILDLLLDQ